MKQLLICKGHDTKYGRNTTSDSAANITRATLNILYPGSIALFEQGASSVSTASPTKNFEIYLGRGSNLVPFCIPEVDIDTLTVTKTLPTIGTAFKRVFTFPSTPTVGKEYGIMFIKKEVVPHERNTYCVSIVAGTATGTTEATALVAAINNSYGDKFTASNSGTTVTIVAKTVGEQWDAKMIESLIGTAFTTGASNYIDAVKPIGDKAFIQELASKCTADKGHRYTDSEGMAVDPGYPEEVEDFVLNTGGGNGTSSSGYALFTLRFATKRDAGKTTDERVWQVVHIAVPVYTGASTSNYSRLNTYLPEGKYTDNIVNAATTTALAGKADVSNNG